MKYTVNDFLNLRIRILRNSILNHLLVAVLSGNKGPIKVGTSIIRLEGELKNQIIASKKENSNVPNFIKVDVEISLDTVPAVIQYSYKDFPPVCLRHNVTLEKSYTTYLRNLACKVCDLFSMNASKADKIFSALPKSLTLLLNSQKLSSYFWKSGIIRKASSTSTSDIDENELCAYYDNLRQRLSDWRNFNLLLINLISDKGLHIDKPRKGKMDVYALSDNQWLIACTLFPNSEFYSYIINPENFSPVGWNFEEDEYPEFLKVMGPR